MVLFWPGRQGRRFCRGGWQFFIRPRAAVKTGYWHHGGTGRQLRSNHPRYRDSVAALRDPGDRTDPAHRMAWKYICGNGPCTYLGICSRNDSGARWRIWGGGHAIVATLWCRQSIAGGPCADGHRVLSFPSQQTDCVCYCATGDDGDPAILGHPLADV